ncbi:MAG TPA: helix-turn-helix domain-containing protein [Pseudolabrys sp.]|nr:helix-turn-helix domain-containing protein [Pseudolabrys sp.]
MPRDASVTRNGIIAAAGKLFYRGGIRSVSVDDVAAAAGVTKRTLYYHFRSKDDLIAAYVESRDSPTVAIVLGWMDEVDGSLADKFAAVFGHLARLARKPGWRGCGFLRMAAELVATPGHPALKAAASHKKAVERAFAARIAAAGFDDAAARARQVMVLFDGAFSSMLVHRDGAYAQAAGEAAAGLFLAPRRARRR